MAIGTRAFGVRFVSVSAIGLLMGLLVWPSSGGASSAPTAEVVEVSGGEPAFPAAPLWRGVAILATGAALSTGAYAVAMKRSRTAPSCRGQACLEMRSAEEARQEVAALAESGSEEGARVLRDWLEGSRQT